MALYDGKNFKGGIGNISFRKLDEHTTIVQSKPGKGNVKQSENTKKSASLFGRVVSPFAKHVRRHFRDLVKGFADRKMVNRMNADISIIINQHQTPDGKIVFHSESFSRLRGFEFNANSLLIDSLLLMPTVSYDEDKIHISMPSFHIPKNVKFPDDADHVLIQIQPVFFNLEMGLGFNAETAYIELARNQNMSEAQSFSYNFPAGTVCLIGLSLLFSERQFAVNSKEFSPAGIFAAHYKEGEGHGLSLEGWNRLGFRI